MKFINVRHLFDAVVIVLTIYATIATLFVAPFTKAKWDFLVWASILFVCLVYHVYLWIVGD